MKDKSYERHLRTLAKERIPEFSTLFPSYANTKRAPRWRQRWVFAPILTILVFTFAVWFFQPSEPSFTVLYLEINPSLQVTIDDKETVIDVLALNDDASRLPLTSYLNLSYDDFVDQWFKDVADDLSWDQERLILFDLIGENVSLNEALAERLEALIMRHPLLREHPVMVLRDRMGALSMPELDEARSMNVGLMRYRLAAAVAQRDDALTIEEALDLPVRDLIERRPMPPMHPTPTPPSRRPNIPMPRR